MTIWRSVDDDIKPILKKEYLVYVTRHSEKKEKELAIGTFYAEGWWTTRGIITHWLDELEMPENESIKCNYNNNTIDCPKFSQVHLSVNTSNSKLLKIYKHWGMLEENFAGKISLSTDKNVFDMYDGDWQYLGYEEIELKK